MASITVNTNGQTLTVNASISHWTSAALAVVASGDDDIPSTATTTIGAAYTMHFANTATTVTVTVKQLDGTTLYTGTLQVNPGVGPRTINPAPSLFQVAADAQAGEDLALAPAGALAETYSRAGVTLGNVSCLTSGRLFLTAIALPAGAVVSSVTYVSGTTQAGTPTAQWFALYDSALGLVGQTADDEDTAWAANTAKTLAFAAPLTISTSGLYYVGICVVAATPPTMIGNAGASAGLGIAPIVNGNGTASLTVTAPATSTLATASNAPWAWVS